MGNSKLILGDCLEELGKLNDNSYGDKPKTSRDSTKENR